MIKAIKAWIKSKTCNHNWIKEHQTEIYESEKSTHPYKRRVVYRCTVCCDFKKTDL